MQLQRVLVYLLSSVRARKEQKVQKTKAVKKDICSLVRYKECRAQCIRVALQVFDKRYFVAYWKVFTFDTISPDFMLREGLFWNFYKTKPFKKRVFIS